jgi:hypothetical protein
VILLEQQPADAFNSAVPNLQVSSPVTAILSWDYDASTPMLGTLYERAKQAQWNATTDVDWAIEVPFGAPLPDDSAFALATFEASPLAARGRRMWDVFRWELQSWMISQFLHGEQGALIVAGRLVEAVPDLNRKFCAASQVVDEARHVEVFSRYLREKVPEPYPITSPLSALLTDILVDSRWDVTALGMQIMIEALAMAAFRLADQTFHDDLIQQITRLVARDEARHVSFGILSLQGLYEQMTTSERADREDLVLEAAALMRRRFLLEDVWERLEVDRTAGAEFAARDPLMIAYRQVIFAKVISCIARLGLATSRVLDGLGKLDLLGFSAARIAARMPGVSP